MVPSIHVSPAEVHSCLCLPGFQGDKIQDFFDALGLEEKETLNGIAKAGSCQFSCLADQVSHACLVE